VRTVAVGVFLIVVRIVQAVVTDVPALIIVHVRLVGIGRARAIVLVIKHAVVVTVVIDGFSSNLLGTAAKVFDDYLIIVLGGSEDRGPSVGITSPFTFIYLVSVVNVHLAAADLDDDVTVGKKLEVMS
jgi:hypothetical protein